jgi:uncharacterized phage protein (TIGR02216 family)
MPTIQPFPWREAMAFALGVLRWSPEEFWRATPRELAAAIEGARGGRPLEPTSRDALARLMDRYPDGA